MGEMAEQLEEWWDGEDPIEDFMDDEDPTFGGRVLLDWTWSPAKPPQPTAEELKAEQETLEEKIDGLKAARKAKSASTDRQRCLQVGCNPVLLSEASAADHRKITGHRTAKWPVRSAAGEAKARKRNRSGYYDKYNVGAKDRQFRRDRGYRATRSAFESERSPLNYDDAHPFSSEALGQWEEDL